MIESWLRRFSLMEFLHGHARVVVASLPAGVRGDFMGDPSFVICDVEPGAGVMVRAPLGDGVASMKEQGECSDETRRAVEGGRRGGRLVSRSVVLKRTLCRRPPEFVRWLIAHELAHAHLHNEGRWEGDDPELAADALAAEWGFPRPV